MRKGAEKADMCFFCTFFCLIRHQPAVVGITSQFFDQTVKIVFFHRGGVADTFVEKKIDGPAFLQALVEQFLKRLVGGKTFIPGIAPGFVIHIQAFAGICHMVGDQFLGCHWFAKEDGLQQLNAASFPAHRIR